MNSKTKKWLLAAIAGLSITAMTVPTYAATYQVQTGDTFWKIAKAHQLSLDSLMAVNNQVNPANIQIGQTIQLPDLSSRLTSAPTIPAYSKVIDVISSAYTADPSENGGFGAVDYFGNPLKLGVVAVDPSVIPLGSTLYIQGYSFQGLPEGGMYAKAADIGGTVKGNRIDIFIPGIGKLASSYGLQSVKVYVVK
ncbi:MAG TPA: 3D domain-containing protein [Bacillota bacterium]|nr:3D domain-containing protein [Bacillota bacterium]